MQHIDRSIERDPRHERTKVLLRKTIVQREFAEWKMGFVDTASWGLPPRGMLDYSRLNCEGGGKEVVPGLPSQVRKYVRFFFDGLCRQA